MEKINIEEEIKDTVGIGGVFKDCLVDLVKELPPIETIVSVGHDFKGINDVQLYRGTS